jgi:hypothetical protein
MSIKYKSYGELPVEFYGVKGSHYNKPVGGLWGCRGEEWREWCESEEFCLDRLEKHFFFKLKKGSKVYRVRTKKDFLYLFNKYSNHRKYKPGYQSCLGTIDFIEMSKDYDAVEVVGDIVYKLRFGCDEDHKGLYAWDVPSICVLNVDKVKIMKEG